MQQYVIFNVLKEYCISKEEERKKGGEGRKESRERERRRGVGEDYPLSSRS